MKVAVAVPTILRSTLEGTLKCLSQQSYKDFKVFLIYKGEMRKTVEDYRSKLDIEFIEQKRGLLEEAYNKAFQISTSELLMFTDDDACPGKTWVEDHVNFHINNPEAGIAGGLITGKYWRNYPNEAFELFKGTPFMEEADPLFREYVGYLTKTGLSVDRHEHRNNEKTLAIAGVNMSVKDSVYRGFKAFTYSVFASYIETQIALRAIKKGFSSVRFPAALTYHKKISSLSVPSKKNEWKLIVEKFAFPFIADKFFKVDRELLKELTLRMKGFPREGLMTALYGLEKGLKPSEFRKLLLKKFSV
ncbi:MAG: glycosyltransferase family A protein [Nitrososphaeria archaeon]